MKRLGTSLRQIVSGYQRAAMGLESGQASVEYSILSAMILGGAIMSWPYMVDLLNAFDTYYQSIYFSLGSPIP